MSSPNQPQSAPASGPAVDTRSGRGSKDQSAGGGAIAGALKKIIAKISFRVPLERALQFFADRTGTMLSRRTAMLVSEANKSGGDIQESMESIAKHIQEIQYLERKRRATLRPFIGVMYISFAVFLVTVYLLISSFFKQLANTTFGGSSAVGGV